MNQYIRKTTLPTFDFSKVYFVTFQDLILNLMKRQMLFFFSKILRIYKNNLNY